MIQEAADNAEADKQARELIEARNSAEAQVNEVKKDLEELKDKLTETEINEIETAIAEVEEAVKSNDVSTIKTASEKVVPAMSILLQKKTSNEESKQPTSTDDDVIDAEFTETV